MNNKAEWDRYITIEIVWCTMCSLLQLRNLHLQLFVCLTFLYVTVVCYTLRDRVTHYCVVEYIFLHHCVYGTEEANASELLENLEERFPGGN